MSDVSLSLNNGRTYIKTQWYTVEYLRTVRGDTPSPRTASEGANPSLSRRAQREPRVAGRVEPASELTLQRGQRRLCAAVAVVTIGEQIMLLKWIAFHVEQLPLRPPSAKSVVQQTAHPRAYFVLPIHSFA